MSIVTREGKRGTSYYARVHRGAGKYVYGPSRRTEKEALIDQGKILAETARPREMTVDRIYDWFRRTYPERPRIKTGEKPRASTVDAAFRAIKPFRNRFGAQRPSDIPREELKDWIASHDWATQWVKTMLNDALDSEMIERNPVVGIRRRRSDGRKNIEVPTRKEIFTLADCASAEHGKYGPTMRAMVIFFAFTCMRPGEVMQLEHVDIEGDEIHVRRNRGRTGQVTTPKNHRTRRIILPAEAREAIATMPRALHSEYVFLSKLGRPLTADCLNDYWPSVRSRFVGQLSPARRQQLDPSDNRLVLYGLRHFGATYMLDELGLDEFTVSIQMGHTDGGKLVREVYGHRSEEAARERLRKALNPAPVANLQSVKQEAQEG